MLAVEINIETDPQQTGVTLLARESFQQSSATAVLPKGFVKKLFVYSGVPSPPVGECVRAAVSKE